MMYLFGYSKSIYNNNVFVRIFKIVNCTPTDRQVVVSFHFFYKRGFQAADNRLLVCERFVSVMEFASSTALLHCTTARDARQGIAMNINTDPTRMRHQITNCQVPFHSSVELLCQRQQQQRQLLDIRKISCLWGAYHLIYSQLPVEQEDTIDHFRRPQSLVFLR